MSAAEAQDGISKLLNTVRFIVFCGYAAGAKRYREKVNLTSATEASA